MKRRRSSKYLEFYKECMKAGQMKFQGGGGLCSHFKKHKLLKLFMPTWEDSSALYSQRLERIYWGSGLPEHSPKEEILFTPLRQTIVLFMHNMKINPIK